MPIFTMKVFRGVQLQLARRRLQGVCALLPLCFLSLAMNSHVQEKGVTHAAAGFDQFFLHDKCTGEFPPQPDTCIHDRQHERSFKFGGKTGTVYGVTLRIRGIFEPTTISGGETPDSEHPYFKVGGTVSTPDWSCWEIEVSKPKQTYWLNHYPSVGHKIYKEDFEATIAVAADATVAIRVTDGNDRQIDNGKNGPDRQQIIAGVVDHPIAGQMLRLDVVSVKARAPAVKPD